MLAALVPHLPAGLEVPDELEQAWSWMEEQGWGIDSDHGYFLTPYAGERVLGVVFGVLEEFLEHWLVPGFPVGRLVPIGTIAGDGSAVALWLDDEGTPRFVGLGSEGESYLLADSAVDFLRLVAIGYRELTDYDLGLPPGDEEPVAALGPFRAWVESTFGVVVPSEWPAVGEDEFTDWVDRASGTPPSVDLRRLPDDSPAADVVAGDARALLQHLGGPDGAAALRAVAATVGVVVPRDVTELRWAGAVLRANGLEVAVRRGVVETIFVRVASYPRPTALLDGLDPGVGAEDAVALFGAPEWRGPHGLRYVVDGRYLHLEFGAAGIERLTLMLRAP
ncbi:hypothetical protein [Nocardioides nitrophenolicus]|uniref:hypothetical protein n=1 Tax=Nocardioides nitrophenolicus TaxID=60489 RepID=UPI00195E6279|nr:hypothetical protein [Nocardioides nitrophenolicus]MBM7520109.1 hypothetical protein [Nocardioides nitrophenolicus]